MKYSNLSDDLIDQKEFRPTSKWKFTQMFTCDQNETKARFFLIFQTASWMFVLCNKIFLLCHIDCRSIQLSNRSELICVTPPPEISATGLSSFLEPDLFNLKHEFVRKAISSRFGPTLSAPRVYSIFSITHCRSNVFFFLFKFACNSLNEFVSWRIFWKITGFRWSFGCPV